MRNLIAVLSLMLCADLWAADKHPAAEKREEVFEAIDETLDELKEEISDEDWPEVAELAAQLHQHADVLPDLFPAASQGDGRARDGVWDNWPDFSERLYKLGNDFGHLSIVAKSGDKDTIREAFSEARSNCRSCHMKYRALW